MIYHDISCINSPLLSFDQAREIFESMVTIPYEGTLATHDAVGWDVPNEGFDLTVTEVRLELIRSRASGGERTGRKAGGSRSDRHRRFHEGLA